MSLQSKFNEIREYVSTVKPEFSDWGAIDLWKEESQALFEFSTSVYGVMRVTFNGVVKISTLQDITAFNNAVICANYRLKDTDPA